MHLLGCIVVTSLSPIGDRETHFTPCISCFVYHKTEFGFRTFSAQEIREMDSKGETRIGGKPDPAQVLAAADKMLGRVAGAGDSVAATAQQLLQAAESKVSNLRILRKRLDQQLRGAMGGSTNYAQDRKRQEAADAYDACVREIAIAERVAALAKRYLP